MTTADLADVPIEGATKSETTTFQLRIPDCTLTPVVTGDAVISVIPLRSHT